MLPNLCGWAGRGGGAAAWAMEKPKPMGRGDSPDKIKRRLVAGGNRVAIGSVGCAANPQPLVSWRVSILNTVIMFIKKPNVLD